MRSRSYWATTPLRNSELRPLNLSFTSIFFATCYANYLLYSILQFLNPPNVQGTIYTPTLSINRLSDGGVIKKWNTRPIKSHAIQFFLAVAEKPFRSKPKKCHQRFSNWAGRGDGLVFTCRYFYLLSWLILSIARWSRTWSAPRSLWVSVTEAPRALAGCWRSQRARRVH